MRILSGLIVGLALITVMIIPESPFVQETIADFYLCRNDDCATYIIEDNEGFSWHIECMDGSTASGRTNGAEYGGNCQQMEI